MRLNRPSAAWGARLRTHEGGPARRASRIEELRRAVLSCLLWEDEFYESGQSIADRIVELARQCQPREVAALAREARAEHNLRHVPLLLCSVLARTGPAHVADTIVAVVQRADELAELLVVHARVNGVSASEVSRTVSKQMKVGLGLAMLRFDEYQLAKYDRAGPVRLRDVAFICHPRPQTAEQARRLARLVNKSHVPAWVCGADPDHRHQPRVTVGEDDPGVGLPTPDTWEVALSGGANKRETFERLIREGRLGYLALLRNLRTMEHEGADRELVSAAIRARRGAGRVLPFRYVAAARAAPSLEPAIDGALRAAIGEMDRLPGRTVVLVDVSGSMADPLSARSDLTRMDAAAALAAVVRADELRVFTFSEMLVEVPARRGMAGVDVVVHSQPHHGTRLGAAVHAINATVPHDRLIVVTDEQTADAVPRPAAGRAYMINVASAQHGVGYGGGWVHVDGFSEGVLRYIAALEKEDDRR